jgi:hypothetical protein
MWKKANMWDHLYEKQSEIVGLQGKAGESLTTANRKHSLVFGKLT